MTLLFRFLWTILKARFRSRIGPLDSSTVHFTVLPHDCDLNIHLNAGRFLSFMDISRVELLARMRVLRRVLKRGWRPVVGGAVIRYRKSVEPFERFSVQSRVVGWDEKWFYIEHVLNRADGSMAAIAYARTLLRKKSGTVHPRELIELMGLTDTVSPPLPAFVEDWRRAEDAR
ncbi:MAG TPA: acyl-CoA thioesterase [Thermoanaerobaculia bacterium]|nr:acyl-CoA thioesterase [Thermoanaerobaculia bacterium]